MKNKQYILFDFDGTLFDSQIGIKNAIKYALSYENVNETDEDVLQSFIGPSLHYSFEKHYGFDKVVITELIKNLRLYYSDKGYKETELYDGVKEMLVALKENNKTLAIATAKPTIYAKQILKNFNLASFFDSVQGSSSKGELFPKDRIIATVMKDLDFFDAEDAVMVGDTIYDIKGAQENEMQSIAVNYGYGKLKDLKSARANVIVESVLELRNVLL